MCPVQPVFVFSVPSASACAAFQPSALRIRKSTRPVRKALTRAHRAFCAGVPVRWCRSAGIPETACLFQPVPPNHPEVFRLLHSVRCKPAEAFLRCSGIRFPMEQDGQSRRRTACGEVLRKKQKGRRFRLPVGVFDGGNQSPSGRARSCRSFSCASACTSSGKSLSMLFARNRYCNRSSCRASLTIAS